MNANQTDAGVFSRALAPVERATSGRAAWYWMGFWAALALAGIFLPQVVVNTFRLGLITNAVLLAIAAVGLGFLKRQCGLGMFGVAAFIGLPAYLVGIASARMDLGWAVLIAMLVTIVFAVLVGAVVVRARPLPFAMLTLALAQMLKSTATLQVLRPITGGDDGMTMSFKGTFFGLSQAELSNVVHFWPLAWLSLCLVLAVAYLAGRSRFGQVLRLIQSNEERMRFSGFNTYLPRLAAFTLASTMVAISGVLLALNHAFASPEMLDFSTGGHALVAAIVGGPGTLFGPVIGAFLYQWGQDAFGTTGHLELFTGIALVTIVAICPRGIGGLLADAWGSLKRRAGWNKEADHVAR